MAATSKTVSERWPLSFPLDRKRNLKEEFERQALPLLNNLHTVGYYLTKNREEAEDLVQETYLRAFRYFDRFESGTNLKAWLLSIMRNIFINRYRAKKREPEMVDWGKFDETYESIVSQNSRDEKNNPETLLFSKVMDAEIENALRNIPEEFRTAIVLVDLEDLNYEEAAEIMGCAVGTIRSRLSRGRRLLQIALRGYASERGLIRG